MEWLSIWLKKIILLVLLAAFLDLILPNTSLQRYVKMVMGLLILLTILSPLFSLFNLSQEELALKMSKYQTELTRPGDEEWKVLTNRLLETQDEQTAQYVENQMAGLIREQVKQGYGVELAEVAVTIDSTRESPRIKQVAVVVADPAAEGGTHDSARPAIKPVEPIQPIEPVRIALEEAESSREPDSAAVEIPAAATNEKPLYRQIQTSIAQTWAISPAQVQVKGEPSGE